jgi:hypothetical protein
MNRPVVHQRCWNHECVSEHELRLLCAACLVAVSRKAEPRSRGTPPLALAVLALAGILAGWFVFFSLGEALMTLRSHPELRSWQER